MSRKLFRKRVRLGFTLVELLVVIAIIGLLAALAIPAAMRAIGTAQAATMKMEVDSLASAIEQYRSKYGEYPPDGSSWTEFQRHCRKAFPQILSSELLLFSPGAMGGGRVAGGPASGMVIANDSETLVTRVMEPAEALVLFLGGLSADPQRPFTGAGGPFVDGDGNPATTADLQYNPARTDPLFEFNAARLTAGVNTLGFTVSNDEARLGSGANDLLPVYLGRYGEAPYAYFNSRTYTVGTYIGRYAHTSFGSAVPYLSDEVNTTVTPQVPFFQNKTTFQILGAGMDGKYNDVGPAVVPTIGTIQRYTSSIAIKTSDSSYDNVADFSESAKLGDAARAKQ